MKHVATVLLLLAVTTAGAQKKSSPDAWAKTITAADLRKHLYIVAGPQMEGRETATEGQRKAAAYIENEFRRIGLQPGNNGSYQQNFPLYQDSLSGARMEVNGQAFNLDTDFNVSLGNSMPGTLRFSEVVLIGSNALDTVKNANLAGRVVLVSAGGATPLRGQLFQALAGKGPAAIITVGPNFPRTSPAPRKGGMSLNAFRRAIAPHQVTVSESVARAIASADWEAANTNSTGMKVIPVRLLLEVQKTTNTVESSNVLGVVPGTDLKDEYLFITAHYDHEGKRGDSVIFYGADDDGSGTVSVIELAEAFARARAAGKGPRRSIVFMTVSGEERGLLGSEYYGSHPVFPLEKTTADLNIDMIGRIDPKRTYGDSTNYVYVVGDDKLSSDLRPISEAANKKYTKLELDYKYNDPNDRERIYYRSDHYNFARHGVPIIFYFNGTHADYHRPTDTPDKINYELMHKRALLVFYTAWEMANRSDLLKRDRPLPVLSR